MKLGDFGAAIVLQPNKNDYIVKGLTEKYSCDDHIEAYTK